MVSAEILAVRFERCGDLNGDGAKMKISQGKDVTPLPIIPKRKY